MNYLVQIMIDIEGQYYTPQEVLDKIDNWGSAAYPLVHFQNLGNMNNARKGVYSQVAEW